MLDVVLEGKVGQDDAIDAHLGTLLAECLETIVEDGVHVAHEDEGNIDVTTDVPELFKEYTERHTVAQGTGGGILDDGAIGHGVGEGHSDLYHVDAIGGQGTDDIGRAIESGSPRTEVDTQQVMWMGGKKLVDTVHIWIFLTIYNCF